MATKRMGLTAVVTLIASATILAGCGAATPVETAATTGPSASPTLSASPSASPTAVAPDPVGKPEYAYAYRGWEDTEVGGGAPINSDGTYGSGCTPPSGDPLPDGIWAVYLTEWGVDLVSFDLVCYYAPESAHALAKYDECMRTTPAGDRYYACDHLLWASLIVNDNRRIRSVGVADGATVLPLGHDEVAWPDSGLDHEKATFPDRPMWLYINGGLATQVHEDPLYYWGWDEDCGC